MMDCRKRTFANIVKYNYNFIKKNKVKFEWHLIK
jgi:hypothetical protein